MPPFIYQSTLLSVQSFIIPPSPSIPPSSLPPTLPPSRRSVNFSTDGGSRTENRALVSAQFLERTQHLPECPVGGSSAAARTSNSRKEEEERHVLFGVCVLTVSCIGSWLICWLKMTESLREELEKYLESLNIVTNCVEHPPVKLKGFNVASCL